MNSCGVRTAVIDDVNHATKHLSVAESAILCYDSGYATHNVTKTVEGTTQCRCIMLDFIYWKRRTLFVSEETGQAAAILVQRPENKIYTSPFSCTTIITVPADITCPQEQR